MSVIPEVLIQRIVVNGMRQLRKDPRLLDALFKNLTQVQLQRVKEFILDTSIQFNVNYPREGAKVPSLTLLLKNEVEGTPFLGDLMNTVEMPDTDLSYDTLGGHGASISESSGLSRKIAGPLSVEGSDDNTLTFAEDATTIVESLQDNPVGCAFLYVIKGTGVGQVFPVKRLSSDSLEILGTFDPQLDDTSVVDLREPDDPELALGEPSRVYDAEGHYNRLGAQYDTTYHLQIVAGGQDEVIYLFQVMKALFISQRALLEAQGLINLRISGSDFAPKTEYLPVEAFQRQMVLNFTYPFTFIEELQLPKNLIVSVTPEDPYTGESCETVLGASIEL
jgi:hypothetical protein